MTTQWRKSFLTAVLSMTLAVGNITPAFAGAAPDGQTDAAVFASQMGMNARWEAWKAEWEESKNDWTQVSLTPGSDSSKLNFAWYSKKEVPQAEENETEIAEAFNAEETEDFGDEIATEEIISQDAEVSEEEIAETDLFSDAFTAEPETDLNSDFDTEPAEINSEDTFNEEVTDEFASEEEMFDSENPESREISAKVAQLLGDAADTTAPKLIIGEGRNMKNAKAYVAVQQDATTDTKNNQEYFSNKVTVTGLVPNTTYYYSYELEDGTYTTPAAYSTKSNNNFSFIFVGDPQIGSSNPLKGADTAEFYQAQSDSVRSDSFNWETTLNAAMEKTGGNASFVVSAGDQIQTNKKKAPGKSAMTSEMEYTGYLSPDILKSLPVATTVGNHDADNANYTYHFNTPNNSELGSNGIVGGDYYFTYGNTLFMMLNTQDTNTAEHKQFMEQAIAANPNCTWRIVTLHQDIYGSAEHSNEPEITNLRYTLVPFFEENDIDVVLTGHDHAYSRSKMLLGGQKTTDYTDDEFDAALERDLDAGENPAGRFVAPGNISADSTEPADVAYLNYLNAVMDEKAVEDTEDGETVVNPEGILYMTANSSSGSKYYDLVPRMQTYIAGRWQEDVPTYSVVNITDTTFTINTYRTDNDQKIDETFTIKKGVTENLSDAKVSSIKNQVYTGKAITPSVEVTMNGKGLEKDKDYTVQYSSNVNTGLAKVTLTGKGTFTGTKTVTFNIVPKAAELKSVTSGTTKTAVVSIKKSAGNVTGYAIQIASDSKFKNVKTYRTSKTSYTIKNLTKGKTYYVRVKAFTKINGKNVYGAASKTLKVKVK